jgi:hypothetical protein
MKILFATAGFALSVGLIAEVGFALPRASSVERSPAVERLGFGCNFINGKLVCGKSESSDDEDNQKHMQDDEDDNQKHKKKAKDTDSELTECTIQQSPGGCAKGFKHVCEKLKSGKKCCGCVPDKNAQAPAGGAGPAPAVVRICCDANLSGRNGPVICSTDNTPPSTEAEMRALFEKLYPGKAATTCAPECLSPNGATAAKYCH